MLVWTASTRSEVIKKASDIKSNHKIVVDFINDEVNKCSLNNNTTTSWGENCNSVWTSKRIVKYILENYSVLADKEHLRKFLPHTIDKKLLYKDSS